MDALKAEESAALLLPTADDDDDSHVHNRTATSTESNFRNDQFPVIKKRPKTYQRHPMSNPNPLLCFGGILGAFIVGCLSGVIIMTYRLQPGYGSANSAMGSEDLLKLSVSTDMSIQKKLLRSIKMATFANLNRTLESENDAANKLYEQWKSYSPALTRVTRFSYDVELSKYAPSTQWNGIKVLDKNESELLKLSLMPTDEFISLSSLVKSGSISTDSVYFVNYGRQEDFAYLFSKRIEFESPENAIVFMRRQRTIISQTEQILQAIHYGFGALVLFDDNENLKTTPTNNRHSFYREWARYSKSQDRQQLIDGTLRTEAGPILVLQLSYDDVQRLFGSFQSQSSGWMQCPPEWYDRSTTLKLGGKLSSAKLRLTANVQTVKQDLPVVMSSVRSSIDNGRFVMIGFQLGKTQQNKIINEIIEAYTNQTKYGWKPKRSLLFCAWSGLDYDRYSIRRWLANNRKFIEANLIAYLDLGNDILANSTINLHGSSLLEQVAQRAADFVPSPLQHNHTCHHRLVTTTMSTGESHEHGHDRKRRDGDEHQQHQETNENENEVVECEPHKLLDEWLKARNNQTGVNKTLGIVQPIDVDSAAALFQLQYGIPSLLIEMTQQQALANDTFYVRRAAPVLERGIQAEVYAAYTQFVIEIVRQLVDEPLIPFNLTDYANQLEKQSAEYVARYVREYASVGSHIGSSNDFVKSLNGFIKSIRDLQSRIDQISKAKDYIHFQPLNEQLNGFERLFISSDPLPGMNANDKVYKHVLIGPAFGLTNTVVPFPSLSNILLGVPDDPPTEICDASKIFWANLKQHINGVTRALNGFDELMGTNK